MQITNKRDADQAMKMVLDALENLEGIKATFAGGTFGDGKLTIKLNLTSSDPAEAAAAAKAEWDRYAYMFGLKPEHFGFQFKHRGVPVEFCGLDLKRRKFPIRIKELTTGRVLLITQDEAEMRVKVAEVTK